MGICRSKPLPPANSLQLETPDSPALASLKSVRIARVSNEQRPSSPVLHSHSHSNRPMHVSLPDTAAGAIAAEPSSSQGAPKARVAARVRAWLQSLTQKAPLLPKDAIVRLSLREVAVRVSSPEELAIALKSYRGRIVLLRLERGKFADADLQGILSCSSLRELEISDCSGLTAAGIAQFDKMNLTHLSFRIEKG